MQCNDLHFDALPHTKCAARHTTHRHATTLHQVLMPHTRLALLYMERAHRGEHGTEHKGIAETLASGFTGVAILLRKGLKIVLDAS